MCSIDYPGVERILVELKKINYYSFPNATHDLLRTFLECSLKAYFDSINEVVKPGRSGYTQLKDVLDHAEKHFKTIRPSLVQPIRVISSSLHSSNRQPADVWRSRSPVAPACSRASRASAVPPAG